MFNLTSYLEKFKKIDSSEDKNNIKKILFNEININIEYKNILIKENSIIINGSSIQKNIIFLKKETLLFKIKEFLPYIKDIS